MPLQSLIKRDWYTLLAPEVKKTYFCEIMRFLKAERARGKNIYPAQFNIFHAIQSTAFSAIKVVILGQDPYHSAGQAHGLSFSVPYGMKPPPSLLNIFKELRTDCGIETPTHGCLQRWASQGVLLLNSILTVEENKPQSHADIGWQHFTNEIIRQLNHHPETIIYLLWGSHAQKKQDVIDTKKHIVLTAPHPSPLSAHRGFLGCNHFSKTNELLLNTGRTPIDWRL